MENNTEETEDKKTENVSDTEKYINIKFQEGDVLRNGKNGAEFAEVVEFLAKKLRTANMVRGTTDSQKTAYVKLKECLLWLKDK